MSSEDFRLVNPEDPERVLRGRIDWPEGQAAVPWVLLVHGFGGSMLRAFFPELARRLVENGFAAVRFNMSCAGLGEDLESFEDEQLFGRGSYSKELEDIAQVRAHLESEPRLDPARAAILGHSRGGGMALIHAARRGDYAAACTWAGVDHVLRFSAERQAEWERRGEIDVMHWGIGRKVRLAMDTLLDVRANRAALDVGAACARLSTPTLVVQGTRDPGVTVEDGQRLASSFAPGVAELCLIEGAGHNFGAQHPMREVKPVLADALDTTLGWLQRQLGRPGA